jgi:predicted GTPase
MHRIHEALKKKKLLVPLDVLLVGGTGAGKSSTVNALAGSYVAKVGHGVNPETKHVQTYHMSDYLSLHDSAGLGDGKFADVDNAKDIIKALNRACRSNGNYYRRVDLILAIVDGSSRDLGTIINLLENAVLGLVDSRRVIVAINQADMAMKGRYWNDSINEPADELLNFLKEQSSIVRKRLKESLGVDFLDPVFYSANKNYNIDSLVECIVNRLPSKNRLIDI